MPLHVTATLESIKGCGPLRSVYLNVILSYAVLCWVIYI